MIALLLLPAMTLGCAHAQFEMPDIRFVKTLSSVSAVVADEGANLTVWRGSVAGPGVYTSEEFTAEPFDRAVMSWNATGGGIFELGVGEQWYVMGRWGSRPQSVKAPGVNVDTLELKSPATKFRFRLIPDKRASVSFVSVTHWRAWEKRPYGAAPSSAWGKTLEVPQRSQDVERKDPGKICSPTSLSMLLEFHGRKLSTRKVADGVYDHEEKIYGNWPFNTAYAHQASGLEAFVRAAMSLEDLEAEISAGRPAAIRHNWKKGDLDGAPMSESDGHVIVVVGFTPEGDVIVNDPAGRPGAIRRVYKRKQLYHTWIENGPAVAYILRPAKRL